MGKKRQQMVSLFSEINARTDKSLQNVNRRNYLRQKRYGHKMMVA